MAEAATRLPIKTEPKTQIGNRLKFCVITSIGSFMIEGEDDPDKREISNP